MKGERGGGGGERAKSKNCGNISRGQFLICSINISQSYCQPRCVCTLKEVTVGSYQIPKGDSVRAGLSCLV